MPSKPPVPFQLQERDVLLLRDLLESRVMNASHVAALHFGGRPEATKKRLQTLKAAKLIAERPRRPYEAAVLTLAPDAFTLLKERGLLEGYPSLSMPAWLRRAAVSDATIRHELEVMDVRVAIAKAVAASPGLTLASLITWPRLIEFGVIRRSGEAALVRPDGMIRIAEEGEEGTAEHCFFLEVDRSSESLDVLAQKAIDYREHYRGGGFAVRNGGAAEDFKDFPFRVLFVLKSAERRNNIAERLLTLDPPILQMVMLATIDEATADPLGSVWACPADYRDAVAGTRFGARRGPAYVRDGERERFVASRLARRAMLG